MNLFDDEKIEFYKLNPVAFIEDVIFNKNGVERGGPYKLANQQRDYFTRFYNHGQTLLRGGRGVARTATSAFEAIHAAATMHKGRAIIGYPVTELKQYLLDEVTKWLDISILSYTVSKDRFTILETDGIVELRNVSKTEAVQGICGDFTLIIDDAQATRDDVLQIVSSYDNVKLKVLPSTITTEKIERNFAVSVYNSEYSDIVSQDWVKSMKEKHIVNGIPDNIYRIHVQGEYPTNI